MLDCKRNKSTLTIKLSGELDHHYVERIRRELDEMAADPQVKQIIFDLSKLTFMDSSGIGMIIGRYKQMARRGGKVSVRCSKGRVDRIFEMAGLYQIIEKLA